MAITDRQTGSTVDVAFGIPVVTAGAPTVAEIGALDRLECFIVDSIDTPRSGSTVDISALCQRETFNVAATIENGDISMTLWREFDGTDTAWAALDDSATVPVTASLVLCRAGFTGAGDPPASVAADVVDIYTVQVVSRSPVGPSKTEGQRFEVTLAVVGVEFDVAVVA